MCTNLLVHVLQVVLAVDIALWNVILDPQHVVTHLHWQAILQVYCARGKWREGGREGGRERGREGRERGRDRGEEVNKHEGGIDGCVFTGEV